MHGHSPVFVCLCCGLVCAGAVVLPAVVLTGWRWVWVGIGVGLGHDVMVGKFGGLVSRSLRVVDK